MLGRRLLKVPYLDQTRDWPTGCESVSAVMLLQYLGYDITVERFVEDFLEKEALVERNGILYGPDPRVKFAGHPRDDQAMGCYAPVIVRALSRYLEQFGRKPGKERVVDLTGVGLTRLLEEYVEQKLPVIFWASLDLKETIPGPEWIVKDNGERFLWRSNEHCMLLVGYDATHCYFNDPWHNHGCIAYDRALVSKRHGEQYEMAVSIIP